MLTVEFLGTRGAFPLNLPETQKLGTETASVIVKADQHHQLILDAGTGLNKLEPSLGNDIILLSHFHYDHVLGLPYFLMRKRAGYVILVTACAPSVEVFRKKLASIFGGIGFPVELTSIFKDLKLLVTHPGKSMQLDSWTIDSCELNHPGQAFGYRIHHAKSPGILCYLMDHEHRMPESKAVVSFADNADLIIFDAAYEGADYEKYSGYGHSTIEQGRFFRVDANAGQIAFMGHSMERTDIDKSRIDAKLDREVEQLAYDGLLIHLPKHKP